MIDGVKTKKLKVIPDERGHLMEILRSDDELFNKFGQVYITTVYPGVVKAWHYHKKQTDRIAVIKGMAKLVLYDNREGSPTKGEINEFFIGEHNAMLICVPKLVMHGFKGIGDCETVMLNCPSEVYNYENPDEFRLPACTEEIPYNWAREDK